MGKRNKITNITLICTLIGIFLGMMLTHPSAAIALRVPMGVTGDRVKTVLKAGIARSITPNELASWLALEPVFPINTKYLPGFKRFIFKLGTTFGSRWNRIQNQYYGEGYSFHHGTDFSKYITRNNYELTIQPDTPIRAMLSGKVIWGIKGYEEVKSRVVVIESPIGVVLYSHVIPLVAEGSQVKKGDVIGRVRKHLGEESHLHLGVLNGSFNFPSRKDFKMTDQYYETMLAYFKNMELLYSFDPLLLWPSIVRDSEILQDNTISPEAMIRSIGNASLSRQSI